MAGGKTQFEEFLEQEVRDSKGVYFPVKTSALTRMLVRSAKVRDLHPNPEDEFCMPEIGPNHEIISRYQKDFLNAMHMNQPYYSAEPLFVEKTYPNGYRISLHIDDESIVCSLGGQYGYRTYLLNAPDDGWKEKIIERAEEIRKLEERR